MDINISREIRAIYNDQTIRVYQAYNNTIANNAIKAQCFTAPWKPSRMTWIKPSFVWMGYRSGWSKKDLNQARILALDLNREAFDKLITSAVPAKSQAESSEAIVQWDPERTLSISTDDFYTSIISDTRSIQIGLRGSNAEMLMKPNVLINSITDVTDAFLKIYDLLDKGDLTEAMKLLPEEKIYIPKGGDKVEVPVEDPEAKAIVVLGGAFNPIHMGHITALLSARDYLEKSGIKVSAGYLAPAPDGYVKKKYGVSAISSQYRLKMCEEILKVEDPTEAHFVKIPTQCYGSAYECAQKKLSEGAQVYIVTGADRGKKSPKAIPNVHYLVIDRGDVREDDSLSGLSLIESSEELKKVSATLIRRTLCIGCYNNHSESCLENRKKAIDTLLATKAINASLAKYLEMTPGDALISNNTNIF